MSDSMEQNRKRINEGMAEKLRLHKLRHAEANTAEYRVTPNRCPECGGQIQATRVIEDYLSADAAVEGSTEPAVMREVDSQCTDLRWYCENDHELENVVILGWGEVEAAVTRAPDFQSVEGGA